MLTETPNNNYSASSCNFCGISSQVLKEVLDEFGLPVADENLMPVYYNDEPVASAEMTEHIQTEHPPPGEDE